MSVSKTRGGGGVMEKKESELCDVIHPTWFKLLCSLFENARKKQSSLQPGSQIGAAIEERVYPNYHTADSPLFLRWNETVWLSGEQELVNVKTFSLKVKCDPWGHWDKQQIVMSRSYWKYWTLKLTGAFKGCFKL